MPIDFAQTIAGELAVRPAQVARSIELFDDDNTVPFVARYRKEVTGGLDEVQLRTILERLTYLRNLEARKEAVLKSIEEQGKLTDELRARIEAAATLQEVEDLYLPYKPKRRTRATIARERGLEPLAQMMLAQELTKGDLAEIAAAFLTEEVPTAEDAYAGARDIIAEMVAEDADMRAGVRERTRDEAWLVISCRRREQGRARRLPDVLRLPREAERHPAPPPAGHQPGRARGRPQGQAGGAGRGATSQRIQARMITNPRSIFADQLRAGGGRRLRAAAGPLD